MISPNLDSIRLFLHVLAAAVWVGGQIVLGALVPRLRAVHPDNGKALAKGFAKVAWPAFGLAVITGIWSVLDVPISDLSNEYRITLAVHVVLAVVAATAAFVHSIGRTKLALALGGAVGLLASLAALFVGVLLAG